MKKWLPWLITAVFAVYAFGGLRPAKVKDFDWQKFGRLPVLANGRFQPLDSLARNSLLQLREKGSALSSTALKGPDKRVLHEIPREVVVTGEPEGEPINPIHMRIVESPLRLRVSRRRPSDELTFVHTFTRGAREIGTTRATCRTRSTVGQDEADKGCVGERGARSGLLIAAC